MDEPGWTERSRAAMREFLGRLQDDVESGRALEATPAYGTIARGLDHWGISEGELVEGFLEISESVRAVVAAEREGQ